MFLDRKSNDRKIKHVLLSDNKRSFVGGLIDRIFAGVILSLLTFLLTTSITDDIYMGYLIAISVFIIFCILLKKIREKKEHDMIETKYNEYEKSCFFHMLSQKDIHSFSEFILDMIKEYKSVDNISFHKELSLYTVDYTGLEGKKSVLIRFMQLLEHDNISFSRAVKSFENIVNIEGYKAGYLFTDKIIKNKRAGYEKIKVFDGSHIMQMACEQNKLPGYEDVKKHMLLKSGYPKINSIYKNNGLKFIYLSFVLFFFSFIASYRNYYVFASLIIFFVGTGLLIEYRGKKLE